MRVLRRAAFQGHAVPATAGRPVGPFSAEVLAKPVISDDVITSDNPYPFGATAQNDYQGIKTYQCRYCSEIVTEDELDAHICGGAHGED
jgi:5-methylcytosine-specific restriction endonuclease McrA